MRRHPVAGEVIPTPRGKDVGSLYTWAAALCTVLTRRLTSGEDATGSVNDALATKAGLAQIASGHWLIPEPENKTYAVIQKAAQAFTITDVTTIAAAGSCTVTVKINGVSLGGTANSASTSEQSQAHTTANEVAEGDTVAIVISSTSSCEMLTVDIAGTLELDP
jgi:hypothetical protein